jgi:N-hydroxyarylamine O-acetyltransferase
MTDESAIPGRVAVDAYLARIGYAGPLEPTVAVLEALHLAHATHIPFENLDILLGRPIRLDLECLQAKLVAGGRGGYCFEQNTLFAAVLAELGFRVTLLAARVRFGANRILPRTHMALQIRIDDAEWLADVGFGAAGLLLPIRFADGAPVREFAWTYRLVREAGQWVLQSQSDAVWQDLYAFTLDPQLAVDFEVANHYVSTHPQSRFVQSLTVQQVTREARHALVNRDYSVDRGTEVVRQTLRDDAEVLALLAGTFGLSFPSGTRFRVPAFGA